MSDFDAPLSSLVRGWILSTECSREQLSQPPGRRRPRDRAPTIARGRARLARLGRLGAGLGLAAALLGCGGPGTAVGAATTTRAIAPPPSTASPVAAAAPPASSARAARWSPPRKPPIVADPIAFGPRRRAEMVAYAERHYHLHTYRLLHPRVIVEHYTGTSDLGSALSTFAADVPDSELHELPGTCAHFVIDRDGTIRQLVATAIMCRHTVGLNWTAIGIEHVGTSDAEVLRRPRQLRASLALTRWLRCRFAIPVHDVIGHSESLSSPFHHEEVGALRAQTHDDWTHADMRVYRARLRSLGGCPS